eukprot:TRINITY_DN9933_c0_g1_i3.p1 TRINITY_DN9933_c0_g1~~TRINITY_DN9933_c0_g1_i3.p1  ORF type:complete len:774 (-),score=142.82 TRINITY_DN9933_c0_g1_i3:70-2151(-)
MNDGLSNTLWSYNILGGSWRSSSTNMPFARRNPISVKRDGGVAIYGGWGVLNQTKGYLSDLWAYQNSNWAQVSSGSINASSATTPGSREGSCSWVLKNGTIYLIGGKGFNGRSFVSMQDLWSYDSSGNQWTLITSTASISPSYAMTFQLADDTIYIFGGLDANNQPSNFMYEWTPTNQGFFRNLPLGDIPSARSSSMTWTMDTSNYGRIFFLFGGRSSDSKYFNDLYMLTNGNLWTKLVDNDGNSGSYRGSLRIGPRCDGATWVIGSTLYLFGGYGAASTKNLGHLSDLWKIDITRSTSTLTSASPSDAITSNKLSNIASTNNLASNGIGSQGNADDGTQVTVIVIVVVIIVFLLGISSLIAFLIIRHRRKPAKKIPGDIELVPSSLHASIDPSNRAITGIKISCMIGKGNFGEVYQGMWGRRKVALKKLNRIQSEMMQKEISILESLAHPNIVGYYGVAVIDGEEYMVMEFANGGSLLSWLHQNQDVEQLTFLEWILDVANGMEYLSNRGILHKDLALRNLLMASDETGTASILVSDFGLASNLDGKNYYTRQEETPLPVKWSAPEALHFNKQTTASDVWSFGVAVWEMYSHGSNPYVGMSNKETAEFVTEGGRMKKPKDCPDEVYQMMLDCWDREPEKRPTFSEIVKRIEKIIEEMGGTIKETQRQMDRPVVQESHTFYNNNTQQEAEMYV